MVLLCSLPGGGDMYRIRGSEANLEQVCSGCHVLSAQKLSACSRCKLTIYCGKEWQIT